VSITKGNLMAYTRNNDDPANAMPTWDAGGTPYNTAVNGYVQVKTGGGVLQRLVVNTLGTTSSVAFYDGISATVTMTIATPGVITWAVHPFEAGDAVKFTTTGALPTGLTAGTTYYVSTVGLGLNSFSVAASRANALAGASTIATSGSQSGVPTGWDATRPIGNFSTLLQNSIDIGAEFNEGLIAIAAGGAAADETYIYR
jgi:hypothetical protein